IRPCLFTSAAKANSSRWERNLCNNSSSGVRVSCKCSMALRRPLVGIAPSYLTKRDENPFSTKDSRSFEEKSCAARSPEDAVRTGHWHGNGRGCTDHVPFHLDRQALTRELIDDRQYFPVAVEIKNGKTVAR